MKRPIKRSVMQLSNLRGFNIHMQLCSIILLCLLVKHFGKTNEKLRTLDKYIVILPTLQINFSFVPPVQVLCNLLFGEQIPSIENGHNNYVKLK